MHVNPHDAHIVAFIGRFSRASGFRHITGVQKYLPAYILSVWLTLLLCPSVLAFRVLFVSSRPRIGSLDLVVIRQVLKLLVDYLFGLFVELFEV